MDERNRSDFRQLISSFKSPVASRRAETGTGKRRQLCSGSDHPSATLSSSSHRERFGSASRRGFEPGANDHDDDDDDDVPLDDFDRELLAQLDAEREQRHHGTTTGIRRGSYSVQQPITPAVETPRVRGLAASGSSESGPLSSPSLAVKSRKQAMAARKTEEESLVTSPHWSRSAPCHPLPDVPSSDRNDVSSTTPADSKEIRLGHAPPMVQGIRLVSMHELPDRFRSLFPFPLFNAIQSKCFKSVYHGDHNLVLSAPTGSGKTVIMELAICRLVTTLKDTRFKVVYQAPTKSLCSERFRDWQKKFSALDLQCAELTGDTDHSQMRNVQNASIIITTPEKWDSMTRKWRDHARLMQLIKLFLIDEVHILKEARGATLEAVVSRMKSVDSNVRFVALSATVPNSEDIAAWFGRDPTNQHLPAHRERFGEEFRPVQLQKFVCGYQSNGNDFAFDKICDSKLPEVISKHSCRKPIIVFCCTRNSAITTSKNLAKLWNSMNSSSRMWKGPTKQIAVQNVDLKGTIAAGVAFHHAGLDAGDRHAVEAAFLEGQVNVICCTSTLAVGVNLPCHLVIIKNTVSWQDNRCKEYADLEMMQMLGRAGRPQFDDSAVAVILTRKERVDHYEKLVAGSEPLESCLHLNLIDHLNAEIGLGTINNVKSATKWLAGTFFFVRLQKNPVYYKLKEGSNRADEEEMLREICEKDILLLQENSLVTPGDPLKSTQFGDAMARYYVKFETMKSFLSLPPKPKMSEILSVIAQADEFRELRVKSGEKMLFKELNKGSGIRFPIKVDIALAAHKVSLLIQAELGGVEVPTGEQFQKHKFTFQQDKSLALSHVNRLVRCIIDCQIYLADSVGVRNALDLARSLGARVWDNSALQMKQIDQIGVVAVRKLASAGINSIETLENTEPARIEMTLSKNPPFGAKLLARLADFPKPRVSVKVVGKDTKNGNPVKVRFKADIGFMNEKVPMYFHKRPVHVCFLAETSDGELIDFRRMSATKLQKGHEVCLTAELTHAYQYILCYVMCDEIAGTLRQAELKPDLPKSLFPAKGPNSQGTGTVTSQAKPSKYTRNVEEDGVGGPLGSSDDFGDDILNDGDLIAAAEDLDSWPREPVQPSLDARPTKNPTVQRCPSDIVSVEQDVPPAKLDNGKWACNHKCKDKTACKHLCCREGTDKPPKAAKKKLESKEAPIQAGKSAQTFKPSNVQPLTGREAKGGEKKATKKRRYSLTEIENVDLTGEQLPDAILDRNKPEKQKTQVARAAEPYFQRLFGRSAKDSGPPATDTCGSTALPSLDLDEINEVQFYEKDDTGGKVSNDYWSVEGMSDLPFPDDFLPMAPEPVDNVAVSNTTEQNNLDNGLKPTEEVINDDDLRTLEQELTDYEQYINIGNSTINPSDTSPSSRSEDAKRSSPLDSTKTTSTASTTFSSAHKDDSVLLRSDSLFFSGPDLTPSTAKTSGNRGNVNSQDVGVYQTPSKKPRVALQETISPPQLCLNVNTAPAPTTTETKLGDAGQQNGGGKENVWEGIDLSLLEEYKDLVNFF